MNGLIRKLSDPEFIGHINTYDIVVLSETWLSPKSNYDLNINGYEAFHLYDNKSPNVRKGRYSGGISVYYKLELKNKIQIEEKQQSGLIWLKLCKSLFDFDSVMFLCNVYIPPRESRLVNQQENDFFEQIEWVIERYKLRGKVFVIGDWNARTSIEPDFIVFDKYLDNDSAVEPFFRGSDRVNKDHVLDTHGKRIIDLCKSTNLLIGNGRLHSDSGIGEFTFINHNGMSTVDYILLEYNNFSLIKDFNIMPINEFSDHCAFHFCV